MPVRTKKTKNAKCLKSVAFSPYHSCADGERGLALGLLDEGLHLVPGVVACVVVRANDGLDDLAVVLHLGEDLRLLRLHPRGLHGRQDLGLLAFRDAAETDSWKGNGETYGLKSSLIVLLDRHSK